jgi:D-alanyl-D-alanine carboxypeptidase
LIAVVMNTPTNAARQQQSRLLLNYGFAELARREAAITDSMRVHLHGNLVSLDTSPRIYRGRVMLPFD